MDNLQLWLPILGAAFFGAVVGWMAHHVLQRAEVLSVQWLASMIGVIGGGAVTALFDKGSLLFGAYCIGLGISFFARVILHPIGKVLSKEMETEEEREKERQEIRRQQRLRTEGQQDEQRK
jgi:hypothetical protein